MRRRRVTEPPPAVPRGAIIGPHGGQRVDARTANGRCQRGEYRDGEEHGRDEPEDRWIPRRRLEQHRFDPEADEQREPSADRHAECSCGQSVFVRAQGVTVDLAAYDQRMRKAARDLGIPLYPL